MRPYVHLGDADGRDLPHALLAMPPELWDRPRRRLTLLLEPGRIKRGLVPNAELGAPWPIATKSPSSSTMRCAMPPGPLWSPAPDAATGWGRR